MAHQGHLHAVSDMLTFIRDFFNSNTPTDSVNQQVIRLLITNINAYLNDQSPSLEKLAAFTKNLVNESDSSLGRIAASLYTNTLHMCARQLSVSADSMLLLPVDMDYHKFVIKKSKKAVARFIMCMGGQHPGEPDAALLHTLGEQLLRHELNLSTPISWAHVEQTVDKLLKL
jgi:hypothetical protein